MKHKPVKTQSPNSAWPFKLDHVNNWAFWESAFSPEECEQIIQTGTDRLMTKGTTGGKDKQYVRDSEISWLYSCDDMEWVYRRVTDIITDLNDRYFQFDLFGLCEGMQFTRYTAPGGKYGLHVDNSLDGLTRKLSFTLQLSNPADYEGGDLCLQFGDEPERMSRAQGYVAVFPSYVLHEVTPVTAGTRHSLVSWITGPPFK